MEEKPNSPYKFKHVTKIKKTQAELLADIERQLGGQMTENTLSSEQRAVFDRVTAWYEDSGARDVLTLGGYSGTGKSTIVATLAGKYRNERMAFCAYTGKATSVLRKKFFEANVRSSTHEVNTLHGLMYFPLVEEKTGIVRGWKKRDGLNYSLIVVDEASMLDKQLFDDLVSYDLPVLAVGDHGQLGPISGNFNLMQDPALRLETIHRQAQDSPILSLSAFVRRTGQVPRDDGDSLEVQVLGLDQKEDVVQKLFSHPRMRLDDTCVLAYTNAERVELNDRARRALWGKDYTSELKVGDQVICLKNVEGTIFNGMRGIIQELEPRFETVFHYYGKVLFEDDAISVEGPICKPQFGRETTIRDFVEYGSITGRSVRSWQAIGLLLDFGYCLTIHKAQGSSFEHVVVVNDPHVYMDYDTKKRALYTAVTRCSKYLVVLQ